jgi:hypothetical protein
MELAASLMGLVANQPLAPYLFIQRRGRGILRSSVAQACKEPDLVLLRLQSEAIRT